MLVGGIGEGVEVGGIGDGVSVGEMGCLAGLHPLIANTRRTPTITDEFEFFKIKSSLPFIKPGYPLLTVERERDKPSVIECCVSD